RGFHVTGVQTCALPIFARECQVHGFIDACLQSERRARALLEALLPLAHGRHENRAHAAGLALRQRAVKLLERLPGPEHLLEAVEIGRASCRKWVSSYAL